MSVSDTSVMPSIVHEAPRKSKAGRKPIGEHAMDAVLHVRITRSEQEALKALAAERGMSIGGLLRSVITNLLKK